MHESPMESFLGYPDYLGIIPFKLDIQSNQRVQSEN
jgi:hypothetical protein